MIHSYSVMHTLRTRASMAATPAAAHSSIVTPLSVRFTETQLRTVQKLADLNGMEKGEYIRHLVTQDEEKEHRIWLARNQLFSADQGNAKQTTADSVGRQ